MDRCSVFSRLERIADWLTRRTLIARCVTSEVGLKRNQVLRYGDATNMKSALAKQSSQNAPGAAPRRPPGDPSANAALLERIHIPEQPSQSVQAPTCLVHAHPLSPRSWLPVCHWRSGLFVV